MNRLAPRVPGCRLPPFSLFTKANASAFPVSARRHYASSAPKEAEKASAQSGGARSKDAKERAEQGEQIDTDYASTPDPSFSEGAKGRTGGGRPLSSSQNAPAQPKINSASIPGEGRDKLTKEQQEDVDRHNAEFEKKHDRASPAAEDKVDKNYWKGEGGVQAR